MMGSRRGFRERRRRKKASRAKLATKTEAVRAEAHRAAAGRSTERRKARLARHRAQLGELWTWTKGVGLELRSRARLGARSLRNRAAPVAARAGRLLAPVTVALAALARPLGRAARAVLAPIAPYVSRGLFFALRAVVAVADGLLGAATWLWRQLAALAAALRRWWRLHVTPARAAAAVAALAAIVLLVAQFIDYRGVAIGGDQFQGGVQPPSLDRKPGGEPTYYVLAGLAVVSLGLTWLALAGRPLLARGVAAIGVLALVLTLAVNLPQGLDTVSFSEAYEGTEASLLAGFWIQLGASVALAASGIALSLLAPSERSPSRRASRGPEPARPKGTAGAGA